MYNFTFHLELLSHILITGAVLHPRGGRAPGFRSEPVGAVAVRVWTAAKALEPRLSPGPGPSCPPRPGSASWTEDGVWGFIFHPLRESGDEFVGVSFAPDDGKRGPEGIGSVCCTAAPLIPVRGRHDSFLLLRTPIHPSSAGPGKLGQSPSGPVWVSPSVKPASPHRQHQGKSPHGVTLRMGWVFFSIPGG